MSVDELLQKGVAASRAGDKAAARDFFVQAIKLEGSNEQAWLWLSGSVETEKERRVCLERVLAINPANVAAQRGLESMAAGAGAQPPAPPSEPPPTVVAESQPFAPLESPDRAMELEPEPEVWSPEAVDLEPEPEVWSPEAAEVEPEPEQAATWTDEDLVVPVPEAEQVAPKKKKGGCSGWVFWAIIVILGVVFICALLAILGSLGDSGLIFGSEATPESDASITSILYEQMAAYKAEDVDRYMATIHSGAPGQGQMRETLVDLLAKYDLDAQLYDLEVQSATKDKAKVAFVLETYKLRGPAFRDNRVTGVFELLKEDGQWKLYDQAVEDIEYLD